MYPPPMGESLRQRVLLYLGLGQVWVELRALSTRLKRVESELYGAKQPRVARAGDRQVSTAPGIPSSKARQTGKPS